MIEFVASGDGVGRRGVIRVRQKCGMPLIGGSGRVGIVDGIIVKILSGGRILDTGLDHRSRFQIVA